MQFYRVRAKGNGKKKGSANANLLPLAEETDSIWRIESSDQTNYLMHSVIISRSGSHAHASYYSMSLWSRRRDVPLLISLNALEAMAKIFMGFGADLHSLVALRFSLLAAKT